jgi:hypothetical protein
MSIESIRAFLKWSCARSGEKSYQILHATQFPNANRPTDFDI